MGIDLSKPYADQWIDASLDTLDDLGVGWAWWQWRDVPTWGIRSTDGTSLNRAVLQHLARPFLVDAPPGVTAGRGDGLHGHLTVQVQPDHADLPVEVSWSALTLPPPVVDGSCVRSSAWHSDTARIDLLITPGSGCTVDIHAATDQPNQPG